MPQLTVSDSSRAGSLQEVAADVLILPLLRGADDSPATVSGMPSVTEAIAAMDLSADRGEIHRLPSAVSAPDAVQAGSLLLVGVGAESLDEVEAEDLRLAFGAATRSLTGVATAAVALPGGAPEQLTAAIEGAALGAYAFIAHKS